jgi:hypothetical protein
MQLNSKPKFIPKQKQIPWLLVRKRTIRTEQTQTYLRRKNIINSSAKTLYFSSSINEKDENIETKINTKKCLQHEKECWKAG